jgi:hypothetical protein
MSKLEEFNKSYKRKWGNKITFPCSYYLEPLYIDGQIIPQGDKDVYGLCEIDNQNCNESQSGEIKCRHAERLKKELKKKRAFIFR